MDNKYQFQKGQPVKTADNFSDSDYIDDQFDRAIVVDHDILSNVVRVQLSDGSIRTVYSGTFWLLTTD